MKNDINFDNLVGLTLVSVVPVGNSGFSDAEELLFTTTEGRKFRMVHHQSCCEQVYLEDICGDMEDLIGSPILQAEEVSSDKPAIASNPEMPGVMRARALIDPEFEPKSQNDESETWTYYRLATAKGDVVLRWYGSSNGYYSEEVDFDEIT